MKKVINLKKDQRNFFIKHKILTFILVVVVLGGIWLGVYGNINMSKAEGNKTQSKINYSNFLKIKMGSKYEDVVVIIGKGTEKIPTKVDGIKTYTWNGEDIKIDVTVNKNIVNIKSQTCLNVINDKVTLKKYNKVKEGMSYNEVKSILGEGQVEAQVKVINIESTKYVWTNKNDADIECIFTDDKMERKNQFDLE